MKKSILVIEDQIYTGMEISEMLQSEGYDMLSYIDGEGQKYPCVTTGENAISFLEQLKEKPSVILMDIRLDEKNIKMDGIETARIINEKFSIPIIFITAYSDQETISKAKVVEPYGYITKPITNIREMVATIEIALFNHEIKLQLKKQEAHYKKIKSLIENGIDLDSAVSLKDASVKMDNSQQIDNSQKMDNSQKISDYAPVFESLSSITRLKILKKCCLQPQGFDSIKNEVEKSKSTLSHHLSSLENQNLIQAIREGRSTIYSFNMNNYMKETLLNQVDGDLQKLANKFFALASNERLSIIDAISANPIESSELEQRLQKAVSTISHHTNILQDAEIIIAQRKGRNTIFNLNKESIIQIFKMVSTI